jgi:monoamine oxidase
MPGIGIGFAFGLWQRNLSHAKTTDAIYRCPDCQTFCQWLFVAGIGGLTTVNSLSENGITNTLLLEIEDRVGGKMWTQRDPSRKSPYYERGAELVNTSDTELISLMKSLGLGLTERRFKKEQRSDIFLFKERSLVKGGQVVEGPLRPFTIEELIEKMHEFPGDREVLKKLHALQNIRDSKDELAQAQMKKDLKNQTARSLVENGIYTKLIFEALMASEFGISLSQSKAETLLDYAKVSYHPDLERPFQIELIPDADEKFRITGGTDSVVLALEKKHRSQIQTRSHIDKIEQLADDDFRITYSTKASGKTQSLRAKHVVLGVPSYELAQLNIVSPELSAARIQEAAAQPFGHNAKVFLIFKEKFWDANFSKNPRGFGGVGLLESGVQFWDTTENQKSSRRGVITLYPGRWPTEEAEQQKRLAEVLAELRQVPGLENLEKYLEKVDVQNWTKSYAGAFNLFYRKAPKVFAEKLKSNIYFVGSDKDNNQKGEITASFGYINGAVRTALKAAQQILNRSSRPAVEAYLQCSKVFGM